MIIRGITNDLLGLAIQATALRDLVYSHNIANNDTPRFKKFEVHFEDSLQRIRENYNKTGELNTSRFQPVIKRVHTNLSTRIDGNNVDINEESILQYRNAIVYDALVNSLVANRQLHSTVYNNLK